MELEDKLKDIENTISIDLNTMNETIEQNSSVLINRLEAMNESISNHNEDTNELLKQLIKENIQSRKIMTSMVQNLSDIVMDYGTKQELTLSKLNKAIKDLSHCMLVLASNATKVSNNDEGEGENE